MGCASAKPKRTTSIEDVTGSKQPQKPSQVPDKNGQVSKTSSGGDKISREKPETNAIEIPGTHKSFMAPDNIPFIDEDVESEVDEGGIATMGNQMNDSRNVKHGTPDQNKNIAIVTNKEVKITTATAGNPTFVTSALREEAPGDGPHVEALQKELHQAGESAVISEIKKQEIHITTTTTTTTKNQDGNVSSVTDVKSRTILTDVEPKKEEEIAATKIQAGIRGYLDRQKVKVIRAEKQQHPNKVIEEHENIQQHSGPKVIEHNVVEEHSELNSDELHDPKLDAAATKIQANYKGYRTRKEMKTHSK